MIDEFSISRPSETELQAITREVQYLDELTSEQSLRLTAQGTLKYFPGQSIVVSEGSLMVEVLLTVRGTIAVGVTSRQVV